MNFGGFHRLFKAHYRQDGGQALGQHTFAGAGRADQQDIVPAGRGNFQGALGIFLSFYFAEIRQGRLRQFPVRDGIGSWQRFSARQGLYQLLHCTHRVNLNPLHHAAFGRIIVGNIDAGIALPGGLRDHGKYAIDGAKPPIQRNFSHKGTAGQRQIQSTARA